MRNILRKNDCNNSSRTRMVIQSYWTCLVRRSVRQFGISLRNGSLVFFDLCTIVDNWNIWKLIEPLSLVFLEIIWIKDWFCYWYLTTNPISGKILVLELWTKMLSQIRFQDSLKCNISRKKGIMQFIFGIQINIEVFYKLILSFWACIARLAQSIKNKKFCISSQYL